MTFTARAWIALTCVTACSTAAVLSNSETDASVSDAGAGALDDSGSVGSDGADAVDSGLARKDAGECPAGAFGAVDHSWSIMPNRPSFPNNGAIAVTPRGVAAAQLSPCPLLGYDIPDGFNEFIVGDSDHLVCGTTFARSVTRAIAYRPTSSGAGEVVLAMSGEGSRQAFLYPLKPDASTFSVNPMGFTDSGPDYPYINAMVFDDAGLHIAGESSSLPSYAVALRYASGSLVSVDYEDTAMKAYYAVTTAPSGTYYVGETSNGNVGVRRLTALGQPDAAFGQGGLAEVAHAGAAGGVGIDSAGRVLIAATTTTDQIFVVRLTASGELDPTFKGGRVDLAITTTFRERIGMVIEPSGSVVVGGLVATDGGNGPAAWLARVAPDASVTSVRVADPVPPDTLSLPMRRVALAREEKCGYLYGVALTGRSTLWRAHW